MAKNHKPKAAPPKKGASKKTSPKRTPGKGRTKNVPETRPEARPPTRNARPNHRGPNAQSPSRPLPGGLWLYGRHAVAAALANPARRVKKLHASKAALSWLADQRGDFSRNDTPVTEATPDAIDRLLPDGAVHQGLAALVEDLPRARLQDVCANPRIDRPVIVLDQISDPQNIGAIFRSAAAFNACAIITQDRRTPPLTGALAKAAVGAVEIVPCVPVVNISRALEGLQRLGYHCAGLAGATEHPIAATPKDQPLALVLGAEGSGLRQGVANACDGLYRIPMAPGMESLNVSAAAAIALYEATRPKG